MKYLLKDIELWSYNGSSLPKMEKINQAIQNYLNKKYTTEEFTYIIKKIILNLENNNWLVCSTMNPYYPDKGFTVISIDITKNYTLLKKQNSIVYTLNHNKKLELLIDKHEKLSEELFTKPNRNINYTKKNSILFSEDINLRKIELQIQKIAKKNYNRIIKKLNTNLNVYIELYALRWIEKNSPLVELFLIKLKNGSEQEKNIILLQIIPMVDKLSTEEKNKLFTILTSNILKFPSSTLRNKSLALLSLMPAQALLLKKEYLNLIKKIAVSQQLNSNYPAKQILKKGGSDY